MTERIFTFPLFHATVDASEDKMSGQKEEKMKSKGKRAGCIGTIFLLAFILWTVLIKTVDVQAVGPEGTLVGFAKLNLWFHELIGVHMLLYTVTDWLGIIPLLVCICFGSVGIFQLASRKSFVRVDADIKLLGLYYAIVIFAYLFFEIFPINYRPILVNNVLEASYPSSTTLLVLSVMPTLVFHVNRRAKNAVLKKQVYIITLFFSVFMVLGRLVSGVHWITDIVGAVLLSAGLFHLFKAAVLLRCKEYNQVGGNDGIS